MLAPTRIFHDEGSRQRTSLETTDLKRATLVKFNDANSDLGICEELQTKDVPKRELRRKLIAEIEEILEGLEEKLKQDHLHILRRLQSIEQRAVLYGVEDVNRICVFSILKSRLENLPQTIEQSTFSPFRGAKIDSFDYESLEQAKLIEGSLLVYPNKWGKGFKPFHWGNGFNAEDRNDLRRIPKERQKYNYAFDYVKYEETVKEVNHIFFNGYNNQEEILRKSLRTLQTIMIGIIAVAALVMLITLAVASYDGLLKQAVELVGFAAILLLSASELYLACRRFFIRPTEQTEIDKTWEDISHYFQDLNQRTLKDSHIQFKFQWRAPRGLLYLEVKFMGKVPMLEDG